MQWQYWPEIGEEKLQDNPRHWDNHQLLATSSFSTWGQHRRPHFRRGKVHITQHRSGLLALFQLGKSHKPLIEKMKGTSQLERFLTSVFWILPLLILSSPTITASDGAAGSYSILRSSAGLGSSLTSLLLLDDEQPINEKSEIPKFEMMMVAKKMAHTTHTETHPTRRKKARHLIN